MTLAQAVPAKCNAQFAILFMADGLDGVHVGGLLGGDVAEEDAQADADEERHVDGPCRHARRHAERRDERARPDAHQDAYQSARHGYQHRLDKELQRDDGSRGAYGHAQAYLLGALGNGDEHDVHDADTGHQ